MTESELESAVIQLATLYGWKVFHPRPAMNERGQWRTAMSGHKGFPDLTLVSKYKLCFVELKSEKGRLTPEQDEWLELLGEHVDVFVWRPADWTDGTIETYLKWGE